jgi:hypothetical protein
MDMDIEDAFECNRAKLGGLCCGTCVSKNDEGKFVSCPAFSIIIKLG